jgi:hypothetical protein
MWPRWWGREVHMEFCWGNLTETGHLENLGAEGRIILKWTFKTYDGVMTWIDLTQDRERWWALVNTVMNLGIP